MSAILADTPPPFRKTIFTPDASINERAAGISPIVINRDEAELVVTGPATLIVLLIVSLIEITGLSLPRFRYVHAG